MNCPETDEGKLHILIDSSPVRREKTVLASDDSMLARGEEQTDMADHYAS